MMGLMYFYEKYLLPGGIVLIEFQNVSMTYKTGVNALKNISFSVMDGEFLFVIGKSGSGKSSLIKLLTCEEDPSAGHVLIDDYEISFLKRGLIPYLRRNIGMVFQDFRLIYSKTVYENVAFAMEIIGASPSLIKRRVPIVLSIVGLRDKAKVKTNQLSGGEQQRVAIARAMVNNPMLILADEPTGNLDPINSEAIMALLEQINACGTTVIVCTHESNIVNKMKKRVIEISDGRIVRDELTGEYNLLSPSKTATRNSPKQSVLSKDQSLISKAQPKSAPLVRNINIKFSDNENESIKANNNISDTDNDTNPALNSCGDIESKVNSIKNPDIQITNIETSNLNIRRVKHIINDSENRIIEKDTMHDNNELNGEKNLNIVSDFKDSNDDSHLDFKNLIKPRRVGDVNSSEDKK